jgi:hypothetical protein
MRRRTDYGFVFDFRSERLVLDQKTPLDKPSGGGFGPSVQLDDGTEARAPSGRPGGTGSKLKRLYDGPEVANIT